MNAQSAEKRNKRMKTLNGLMRGEKRWPGVESVRKSGRKFCMEKNVYKRSQKSEIPPLKCDLSE